ncbi:MAG: hypothetical protein EP332_04830 [Bacteroidetes bacterium]|nr:MAG: hypothetical protein EP332_04830 [Bacteroidota bacterium]
MMNQLTYRHITKGLWLALLLSLGLSLKLSAILLVALVLARILERNFKWEGNRHEWIWAGCCMAFFGWAALSSIWSGDVAADFKIAERKASFLLLPLLYLSWPFKRLSLARVHLRIYHFVLSGLCLSLIGIAIAGGQIESLFYHELVRPIGQHAVYFSAILLFSLLLLRQEIQSIYLLLFGSVYGLTLVLLSSKLMLGLAALALFVMVFYKLKNRKIKAVLSLGILALITALLLIPNPVQKRFSDVSVKRLSYVNANHIGQDVYLDGLSLRLIQVRLAFQILKSENAWLLGVGNSAAQTHLDQAYKSLDLYAPESGADRGFIGYNFHNQYLQSWVQGGLLALLMLGGIFIQLAILAIRQRNLTLAMCTALFAAFCLTESVFERQQGVMAFLCFTLLSLAMRPEQDTYSQPQNLI